MTHFKRAMGWIGRWIAPVVLVFCVVMTAANLIGTQWWYARARVGRFDFSFGPREAAVMWDMPRETEFGSTPIAWPEIDHISKQLVSLGAWPLAPRAYFNGGLGSSVSVPLWQIGVVCLVWSIVGWRYRPACTHRHSCRHCGYSRAGIDSGSQCPECGKVQLYA